jgi:3-hydroxyacyl-[acyl-carrier-protein] dehydratase
MRFTLLDRVVAIEPGKSITAIKTVSLAEEYLADHFPRFPVLPGVFMLEAMTQAAAWTIRLGEDFAHSIVVLRAARNVKYGDFVEPGRTLTVTAEVLSQDERTTKIKASGVDLAVGHELGAGEHVLRKQLAAGDLDAEGLLQPEHDVEEVDRLRSQVTHHRGARGDILFIHPQGIDQGCLHLLKNFVAGRHRLFTFKRGMETGSTREGCNAGPAPWEPESAIFPPVGREMSGP